MAFLPDGRLLVTEKETGYVRLVNADFALQPEPIVDVAVNSFKERGLMGIAVARVEAPAPWALARITWQGRDVTDEPFDFRAGDIDGVQVVLSTRLASVTGIAVDGTTPVTGYSVVVFAQDPTLWTFPSRYVASAASAQNGRFTVGGLPAGDYFAVAVRHVQGLEWQDPEFLDQLRAHALRVTLGEGQTHTISVPLAPSRGSRRTITSREVPKFCTWASVKPAAVTASRTLSRSGAAGKASSTATPPVKSMP